MTQRVTPQLRMTDWVRTRAFYVDDLGFTVGGEHGFELCFLHPLSTLIVHAVVFIALCCLLRRARVAAYYRCGAVGEGRT